ncbi:MAG: hypothetical protein K0S61_113 [Anaerocolumna sp.]|jgi:hypothetical protein|nr:hypothetical protein [Anaerocolumna sp.]
MPYELLANVSPAVALVVVLGFLLKNYVDSRNKEQQSFQNLVTEVRTESKEREDKLMHQLDKYNTSLQEISSNMKVIPKMQEDIDYLIELLGIEKEK